MSHDINGLAKLLRSFFNGSELRQFISSLEDGPEMMAHLADRASSLAEACVEAASILDRWGMSDAEILSKLHQFRPTRIEDLMAYHRLCAADPTTLLRRTASLEMTASIAGSPVGVYRMHPGQIKVIGRSSEVEIQFPEKLVKLSRLHAWTSWPPSGPVIQDLGSKNGTWVNGRRVNHTSLRHGDQVTLGEITILVQEPDRTETEGCLAEDTLS